jgi:Fe-S cluster biosynthesis and repair protein YggX
MVKTPGCPCCGGGYANLEQFMQVNAFSAWEVRRRIACDTGLKLYAQRLAKEQTSPQALAETVKKRRAQIETDCVDACTITFDYTRDPDYFRDEKAVQAKKEKLANDALARLKKGDSFEKVAKEMSEDGSSAPKGGALGCIRADYMGQEVQRVFAKLEPGTFSPVVKAAWGCCIVMRKKLTEEDILSVIKNEAKNFAEEQMYKELDETRRRAKIQYSTTPASAPAPSPAK